MNSCQTSVYTSYVSVNLLASWEYMRMTWEHQVTEMMTFLQLVLSWHMKAGTMCEFSKKEFIEGLQSLGYELYNDFRK